MKSVVIIKNKLDAQNNAITAKNLKKASESLAQDVVKDYDCRLKDATGFYEDENSKSKRKYHFVMLVNYRGEGKVYTDNRLEKTQIESIYIGKIENVELTEKDNQNKCKIYYKMKKCIQNKRVIINLLDGRGIKTYEIKRC